jgi:TIR domain
MHVMDKRRDSDSAKKAPTRLFISHSSEDKELAKALTTLIDSTLQVPSGMLRCTSDPRFNLVPGENATEKLRRDLDDANVVLGLLTPSSLTSSYVLMELGAAWGF